MPTAKLIRVSFLCALCGLVLSILLMSGGTAYAKSASIHANNSIQTSGSLAKDIPFNGQKTRKPGRKFTFKCPSGYFLGNRGYSSSVSEVGSTVQPVMGKDYSLTSPPSRNPSQFTFKNISATKTLTLVYSGYCTSTPPVPK